MSSSFSSHQSIAWAKRKLDEVDATITQIENSSDALKGEARSKADQTIKRLKESRERLQNFFSTALVQAENLTAEAQAAIRKEWIETETSVQSFLAAISAHSEVVRKVISARVDAEQKSWQDLLNSLRSSTSTALEKARAEFDLSVDRLAQETEKLQATLGKAASAGDESWKAVKAGFAETKAIHDRTVKKIADILGRAS